MRKKGKSKDVDWYAGILNDFVLALDLSGVCA